MGVIHLLALTMRLKSIVKRSRKWFYGTEISVVLGIVNFSNYFRWGGGGGGGGNFFFFFNVYFLPPPT